MWERVRWARVEAGFQTGKSAADSLGMKAGTYQAYERSPDASLHIAIDHQVAARLARKFKVRWEWLLTGQGDAHEAEVIDDDIKPRDEIERRQVVAFLQAIRTAQRK